MRRPRSNSSRAFSADRQRARSQTFDQATGCLFVPDFLRQSEAASSKLAISACQNTLRLLAARPTLRKRTLQLNHQDRTAENRSRTPPNRLGMRTLPLSPASCICGSNSSRCCEKLAGKTPIAHTSCCETIVGCAQMARRSVPGSLPSPNPFAARSGSNNAPSPAAQDPLSQAIA